MKGSVIVSVYSVILIVLFGVSCYLMTIVNPEPLPIEIRRRIADDNMYPKDVPPNDNIYYGLEKIPEDVDADEFRKQLTTTVTKYSFDMKAYEHTQRVVPPIWPNEERQDMERNVIIIKNITNPKAVFETSSPIKGLRRSISDGMHGDQNENSGSVLLKIIDDSGRKKIEIKFVPKKAQTQSMRQNRSSDKPILNDTFNELANSNYSYVFNITEDTKDKVIQIKSDDVILLTIVNDSEVIVNETDKSGTEDKGETPKLIMNISETVLNVNQTEADKEQLMSKTMYTLN